MLPGPSHNLRSSVWGDLASLASLSSYALYALGVVYLCLHLVHGSGQVEARQLEALSRAGDPEQLWRSLRSCALPTATLLLVALPWLWRAGRHLRAVWLKSLSVTVLFSVMALQLTGAPATPGEALQPPDFASVLGFMLAWGVPIHLAVRQVHRGHGSRQIYRDLIWPSALLLLANLSSLAGGIGLLAALLHAAHGLGLLYTAGLFLGLFARVDTFLLEDADADDSPLLRTGLAVLAALAPALLSVMLVFPAVTGLVGLIAPAQDPSGLQWAPFEQLYLYLRGAVHYRGPADMLAGLLTLAAVISVTLALYGSAADAHAVRVGVLRKAAGLTFLCYLLSQPAAPERRLQTMAVLGGVLLGGYGLLRLRAWVDQS